MTVLEIVKSFCLDTATFNSIIGIILYWVPLSLCAFGYTVRTIRNYRTDLIQRRSVNYYTPTDTIGDLIGRGFASTMPLVNLWCAMVDVGPDIFGNFFKWMGRVFSQPLVPPKKKQQGE